MQRQEEPDGERRERVQMPACQHERQRDRRDAGREAHQPPGPDRIAEDRLEQRNQERIAGREAFELIMEMRQAFGLAQ
jgi:hypothetical protein